MPNDMLTYGLEIAIALLSLAELICIYRIMTALQKRSEERTDERREFFRRKAYKKKAEIRKLNNAREKVWRDIRNGKL